jgi:hypothetical protein
MLLSIVLGIAACEGGKSPTAPEVPNVQPAAAAAAAEGQSTGAGEQQAGEEGVVAEAQADKVTICHRTGNGDSHPITIAQAAVAAHLAHGDVMPGTGGLGENCEPTGTPQATGTPTDTPVGPTATPTNTSVGPTATPTDTATNTPVAPSATPTDTATDTPVAPSATPTDTATDTPVAPTATPTDTDTPTNTPVAPTATPSATPSGEPICHLDGSGDFTLTFVAPQAVQAHLDHGDVLPGTGGLDESCDQAD